MEYLKLIKLVNSYSVTIELVQDIVKVYLHAKFCVKLKYTAVLQFVQLTELRELTG